MLDRLLDGTGHIVAADLNAAQNALLELKLAGLRALTYEQFFQLFAQSNRRLFDSLYAPTLRPLLSEVTACVPNPNLYEAKLRPSCSLILTLTRTLTLTLGGRLLLGRKWQGLLR